MITITDPCQTTNSALICNYLHFKLSLVKSQKMRYSKMSCNVHHGIRTLHRDNAIINTLFQTLHTLKDVFKSLLQQTKI